MRAEGAGAKTWLCVALAGWAVCVWVLAMFGMGGSIERLDDDPSLHQALPAPGAGAAGRLGPMAQYGEMVARPLFTDDRRPQPFVIDPMGEPGDAGNDFDYVLTSVLRTPQLQMVILQPGGGGDPLRVRQGQAPESAPAWVLQTVEARRAVFAGPQGERALELRVFDGVGGEPPTAAMSTAGGSDGADPADPMAVSGPVPTAVVDADQPAAGPQAPNPGVAGPARAQTASGPTSAAQAQAAQEQVEAIRRRIEERRARLRQEEMARSRGQQPPNQNK